VRHKADLASLICRTRSDVKELITIKKIDAVKKFNALRKKTTKILLPTLQN